MRQEAKFLVLGLGVMIMVASAAGQQFQLMEASINEIHRGLQSGFLGSCRLKLDCVAKIGDGDLPLLFDSRRFRVFPEACQ